MDFQKSELLEISNSGNSGNPKFGNFGFPIF